MRLFRDGTEGNDIEEDKEVEGVDERDKEDKGDTEDNEEDEGLRGGRGGGVDLFLWTCATLLLFLVASWPNENSCKYCSILFILW